MAHFQSIFCFRSFRTDFLSVFHGEDTVPPQELRIDCNFSYQAATKTSPVFYPVRQLDHVCRVDAEEDVKDFRPLRPGLDPPEIVVIFLCPERAFHRSRPHSGKLHHYVVQQLVVRQWPCRIYYHVAEYLVVYVPFSCSISFGQLSPVYIFRNIRATFPSGVKNDLRPSFGLMLFLTRPKSSAISRRGSNFVSCLIRSSRKLNSRARKN